jgi:Legume lectin domain/Fibronectin type III domain
VPSASATSLLSYHGNFSTNVGQKLSEFLLTPANVNSNSFGKLFSTSVDGQVFAEPLAVAGVSIPGQGTHNVVYVATEHDSVYAIDEGNGQVLWHDSFINPSAGVTTVPSSDVQSVDINPEYGITGTPVIDSTSNTLYVVANTKETGSGTYHNIYRLHALDLSTGQEKLGGPVVVADTIWNGGSSFSFVSGPYVFGSGDGSVNGKLTLNAVRQLQRTALTLANGTVYVGFGSHNDLDPYHGWVVGYNAQTLQLSAVFNSTPNGARGGIWEAGGKFAVDSQGCLYVDTGNGTFDTSMNSSGLPNRGDFGDSVIKLAPDSTTSASNQSVYGWGLKVVDFFTPFNQQALADNDQDLGSGDILLLPDSVGSAAHPHLLVCGGKEGRVYLIDRDNMGKYNPNTDNVVEEQAGAVTSIYGTPAYFNNTLYFVGLNDVAKTFSIANAYFSPTPTSVSKDTYGFPASTPNLSSSGPINGIAWDLDRGTNQLRAYDATSYAKELYTSAQAPNGRDALGTVNKFTVPSIIDGKVFVGTSNSLVAYGLLSPTTAVPAAPSNLTATAVSSSQINVSWSDNSNNENYFSVEASVDGVTFTQYAAANAGSTSVAVPNLQPQTPYIFRVRAINSVGASAYSNLATTRTLAPGTTAGLNFSGGFGNPGILLSVNGSAKIVGSALQLTDGNSGEAGSVFSTLPVDVTHFNTQFQFQVVNPNADGFTFAIQGVTPAALGLAGGALGYGAATAGAANGIPQSVAVKFDLYSNQGEGNDSTGLYVNGAAPTNIGSIDLSKTGINLHSGHVFNASMTYDGATLRVTITDTSNGASATQSYSLNIAGVVGGGAAYVGFTGGTGGLTATQNILNWTYSTGLTAPAAPTGLTASAVSSSQVQLAWANHSSNESGFLIERKTGASGAYGLIVQVGPGATSYTDATASPATQYFYRVRAVNALGTSAYTNEASVTTPAASTSGGLDFSGGFAGAGSLLALNGSAILNGSALQLTDGGAAEAASAFSQSAVNVSAFSTQFTFQIQDVTNPGADGITFCIQNVGPRALGLSGGALGYGTDAPGDGGGISTSVAVKFKLFDSVGEGNDATGLLINGGPPTTVNSVDLSNTGINLHSGDVLRVAMTYDGATLKVTITDTVTQATASQSYAVNIPSLVGGNTAYVGFTGGTGGLTAIEKILSWTYAPTATLAAPTGLAATAGNGQVTLSWNSSPGAISYNIYRSTSSAGEGSTPFRTGLTTTSFTDTGLAAGTTYYYQVSAVNSQGESAKSNEAFAAPTSAGGLNFSGGFATAGGTLALNGSAAISGTALQLTNGSAQAASAFSANKVSISHFITQFRFQVQDLTNPGADGFTFCIQGAAANAIGLLGGGLGYGPDAAGNPGGIPSSVAIKFDLFDNAGEGNDSTGLYTNGAAPTSAGSINLSNTGINLHSGHVFNVAMTYDGATLSVTLTDTVTNATATQSYAVNIASIVGSSNAYVGFTAGTGGLYSSQKIQSWTFTPT